MNRDALEMTGTDSKQIDRKRQCGPPYLAYKIDALKRALKSRVSLLWSNDAQPEANYSGGRREVRRGCGSMAAPRATGDAATNATCEEIPMN